MMNGWLALHEIEVLLREVAVLRFDVKPLAAARAESMGSRERVALRVRASAHLRSDREAVRSEELWHASMHACCMSERIDHCEQCHRLGKVLRVRVGIEE